MKRRRFIQATLLTIPAAASGATGVRLYGTPGSVGPTLNARASEKLLLPLSRSGLPPQFWGKIQSITSVIQNVLESPAEGEAFSASPATYLASYGLDSSDATLQEESVKLVAALSSPGIKSALAARDYSGFMKRLKISGVLTQIDSTSLQQQLESVMAKNANEIRQALAQTAVSFPLGEREAFLKILGGSGSAANEDDLAIACELISSSIEESAPALIGVTIAVALVTVAVAVVLWVAVGGWVYVYGAESSSPASNLVGKLATLDPALAKNYERINRLGAITGDKKIIEEGTRDLVLVEMTAVVNAMHSSGILNISERKRDEIVEAMAVYTYKALGI